MESHEQESRQALDMLRQEYGSRQAIDMMRQREIDSKLQQINQVMMDVRNSHEGLQARMANDLKHAMDSMSHAVAQSIKVSSMELEIRLREEGRKQVEELRKQIEPLTNWRYYVLGALFVLGGTVVLVWQIILPWLTTLAKGAAVTGAKP